MIKIKHINLLALLTIILGIISCNDKFDITQFDTNDPGNITGDTIYIKVNPDWEGFNHPEEIMVGREPLIYVADTDNDQIVMLNLDGQKLSSRTIKHPIAIAQDYRLNLIVCAEFDTLGQTFSAVYKIDLVSANHQLENAPIRRLLPQPDDLNQPLRKYTAACAFYDNSFYISRTGPNNSSIYDPDNSILLFKPISNNFGDGDSLIGRVPNISPTSTGLVSANGISSLASFNKRNIDIVVTLTGMNSFKAQWWNYVVTPIDERYRSAFSPNDGVAFAVPNSFIRPEGCTIDVNGNIFVADAGKDSVYKFNSSGDLMTAFGGPAVFSEPYSVAYFDKILYVADRGNNRIQRFILSTEVQ
ncbi:MAG TPA: hypothetical protein VF870_10035 [Ignavibacteriaceae bacterium]